MSTDDEWGEWAKDFRSAPTPPTDVEQIVVRARKSALSWSAKAAVDVVAHVFGFVAFGLLSVKVPAVWPFASLVMPAFLLSLGYGLHVRRGTWSAPSKSAAAYVEVEWRRKRGALRIHRAGRVLLGVLAVGFSIWVPFFLAGGNGRPDLGMAFLVARLAFAVATFVGTWVYLSHKIRACAVELERLRRVRESLGEEGGVVM
ncbi:MAG: hypothetical protein U0414_03470 [Polyangiaceae bacterium]